MSSSEAWIQVEAQKAKSGKFPEKIGVDQSVYLAWIRDCDARKCQSMLVEDAKDSKANDLLKIRALLFRGELDEAERIIRKSMDAHATPETRMEVLLEQARLAAFSGNWSLCHILSAKALESKQLESLSYLSSLQVHALACFELGEFHAAIQALHAAESLATIFPFSISAHYANVLRARIAARDQGVASGISKISELWKAFRENKAIELTADMVHALVFGSVDILKYARLSGESSEQLEKLILVSFAMTEAMGERLYSALGCLDGAICGPVAHRSWFQNRLTQARREFKRIDSMAAQAFEGAELRCLSASMLASLREPLTQEKSLAPESVTHVIFGDAQWAFQLQPWKATDLSRHPQILSALGALSSGELSKARFFDQVWGNARYASHLHDSSIFYVLNRIKKLIGATFPIREGRIQPNRGVIVV